MATRRKKATPVTDISESTPESRQDKLVRLATARVTKAVNSIRLVGNLGAYRPTDKQVDEIMEALGEACSRIEGRLRGSKIDSAPFTITRVA